MAKRRAALLVLIVAFAAPCARGEPASRPAPTPREAATIGLRTGDHPGFGRVVFDLPPGVKAAVMQEEGRAVVRFTPALAVEQGARPPRNVRAIAVEPGAASLALAPQAQLRRAHLGPRLVLDIADPPAAAVAPPAPPAPALDRDAIAERRLSLPPPAATPPPASATPASAPPAAASAPSAAPAPLSLQLAAEAPAARRAILLPFDADAAAAAFRAGGSAVVVFDQRRPIDLAALRDDRAFAGASVQLLPTATVLRLPLSGQDEVVLSRSPPGWTVTLAAAPPRPAGIAVTVADGALRLAAAQPGGVVSVPDPDTGAAIQVGTLRAAGQAVLVPRRTPEFALPATWLGVAVAAVSDRARLRATSSGFVLAADPPSTLALAPDNAATAAAADARLFTRRFDFPDLPPDALLRRLQALRAGAAATPVPARSEQRMAVAEAMVALGLGVEAQSVLNVIGTDDGRTVDDPGRIGLYAVAALAAGRPADAAAIDDPRLGRSDEILMWRALRKAAQHEGDAAAAPVLAADLPLLLSYPAPLRDRLLPLAAETIAQSDRRDSLRPVLAARPGDRGLDLARAFMLEADASDLKPALDALAKVAESPDRLARARAAARAVELRLAHGLVKPADAADALDKLIYAWRGDGRETVLRARVAELRRQAGQWRPALAMLRETVQLFPSTAAALRPQLQAVLASAIEADRTEPLPAIELVALAEENADLIPEGEAGQRVASRIADRLAALDLPKRAAPVLEKLAAAAPPGPARAEIGTRLALVRQSLGDHAGTLDALNDSAAAELPPALLETRALAFARSAAALGDTGSAAEALARLGTTPALALRAELTEAARDWPAARAALRDLADRVVPPEGRLAEEHAQILLRLATAAAQLADAPLLASLREHDLPRFPPGKLADLFAVLTAGPVQGVADLPRAAQEARLAGGVPSALKTLTP